MSRDHSNPYLARVKARGQTGSGRVSEARVAKSLHARLTPNSGAGQTKGDMTLGKTTSGKGSNFDVSFRLEAKSTKFLSFTTEYEWLTKITTEATNTKQAPAFSFSFTDAAGKSRAYGDWVAIPLPIFNELMAALKCKDEDGE